MQIVLQTNTQRSENSFNTNKKRINKDTPYENIEAKSKQKNKKDLIQDKVIQNKSQVYLDNSKKIKTMVRLCGFVILVVIIGSLFAYGYGTNTIAGAYTTQQQASVGITLIFTFVFLVLGFGLILSNYRHSVFVGFFETLYIVSLTVILSPLLLKLWISIFFGTIDAALPNSNNSNTVLYSIYTSSIFSVAYQTIKISLSCAISQLLLYIGAAGRIPIYRTVITSFLYIVIWNFSYGICLYITQVKLSDQRIYDDYAISYVYIFAGAAALAILFDVPSRHILRDPKIHILKIYPQIFSFVGLFFLWMSFSTTFSIVGVKSTLTTTITNRFRLVFLPEGAVGMFFALSSSTLVTPAISYLFNPSKLINFQDILVGSLSGAIMFGPVAGIIINMSVPIILGITGSLIAVIYRSKFLPGINEKRLKDSFGLMGGFFIPALIGVAIVSPIIINVYIRYKFVNQSLYQKQLLEGTAGQILAFAGISGGMGIICGMSLATMMRCIEVRQQESGDRAMFKQNVNFGEKQMEYLQFIEDKSQPSGYSQRQIPMRKKP